MYMFNRSNEAQNISQFIKGSILEEDNDNEEAKADSLNNDDLFQMEQLSTGPPNLLDTKSTTTKKGISCF